MREASTENYKTNKQTNRQNKINEKKIPHVQKGNGYKPRKTNRNEDEMPPLERLLLGKIFSRVQTQ